MRFFFWIVWSLSAAAVIYSLVRAYKKPQRMVEWDFLFTLMFGYTYVFMGFGVAKSFDEQSLRSSDLLISQIVHLAALAGVIWGWRLGIGKLRLTRRVTRPAVSYHGSLPFFSGIGLMAVGVFGAFKTSVSVLREKEIMSEDTSGYVYLIFYLGFSGMILCLHYLYSRRVERRSFQWLAFGVMAFTFMLPFLMHHRRGPIFAFAVILLFTGFIILRRPPRPLMMISSLAVLGILMLWMLQMRAYVTQGEDWKKALNAHAISEAIFGRSEKISDNEFLNSCQLIGTLVESGKCNYGTGYASMPLNAIPRQWWKNKPNIGDGILRPKKDVYPLIELKYGKVMLGFGASPGTVADAFFEFSYFTPLFFMAVAYGLSRVYRRFIVTGDELCFILYIGALACTLWFVLQQFNQIVVPYCFFVVPGMLVICAARTISPRFPKRKLRRRKNRGDNLSSVLAEEGSTQ